MSTIYSIQYNMQNLHFLFFGISGSLRLRLCCMLAALGESSCCWLLLPMPTKPPIASWWFSGWWQCELNESFVSKEPSEERDTTLRPSPISSSSTCLDECLGKSTATVSSWSEASLFEGESSRSSCGMSLKENESVIIQLIDFSQVLIHSR